MQTKPKPCRHCRKPTLNKFGLTILCDPTCAIGYANEAKAKKALKERKIERQEIKLEKERIKRRVDWLADAEKAFNKYIRIRDRDNPCISCGRSDAATWNAGHYRSVGSSAHLRFSENNVHKQCARPCNKDLSGNIANYRIGLLKKIGEVALTDLENDNRFHKWTIEEAKAIKTKYNRLNRELEKQQELS